ncbi:MAG: CapA family protein [Thermoleophilia bacterium]
MPRRSRRTADLLVLGIWVVALTLVGAVIADARNSDRPDGRGASTPTSPAVSPVSGASAATVPPLAGAIETTTTTASTGVETRPPLLVAAGGDVIGDRHVGEYIDAQGGKAVLAEVAPFLTDAHVAFVNLESPLSDKGSRNTEKDVTFRGRPALVQGLASAGVDVVSLANNHALDWGSAALLDTIDRLSASGVAVTGAGADLDAARAPALLDTPAGTVAVLAFSDILPAGFAAGAERPGVNPVRPERQRLLDDIRAAAESADYVLVSFHWGLEYEGYAGQGQRSLAHEAVDAGADLVIGHHPHVLQGLEVYRDKLIAYSLGDFVFDHYSRATGEAVVLRVTLYPEGPPALTVVPVYLKDPYGIPRPVHGQEAAAILDRLSGFSERLGLTLTRGDDTARFTPR